MNKVKKLSLFIIYKIGRIISIILFNIGILSGNTIYFFILVFLEMFIMSIRCPECKKELTKTKTGFYSIFTVFDGKKCTECGCDLSGETLPFLR